MAVEGMEQATVTPMFERAADRSDRQWFVLHTRSRQEKALSADLAAMRVLHFLPTVQTVRYHGKRKAAVELPLFPSYLFLLGTLDDAYAADRTKRLARIIRVADQDRIARELQSLHLVLEKGAGLEPHPYLAKGVWVEVTAGPFRGVQGQVERYNSPGRLVLQIESLGQATSLEIDRDLLQPIGDRQCALAT